MPAETSWVFTSEGLVALATAMVLSGAAWARAEWIGRTAAKAAEQAIVKADLINKEAAAMAEAINKEAVAISEACERRSRERIDDAKKIAIDAHTQNAVLQTSLAMFREQVASTYVNRETMRDVETRLAADIEKMSDAVTGAIEAVSQRLDRVLENRAHRPSQ